MSYPFNIGDYTVEGSPRPGHPTVTLRFEEFSVTTEQYAELHNSPYMSGYMTDPSRRFFDFIEFDIPEEEITDDPADYLPSTIVYLVGIGYPMAPWVTL